MLKKYMLLCDKPLPSQSFKIACHGALLATVLIKELVMFFLMLGMSFRPKFGKFLASHTLTIVEVKMPQS